MEATSSNRNNNKKGIIFRVTEANDANISMETDFLRQIANHESLPERDKYKMEVVAW